MYSQCFRGFLRTSPVSRVSRVLSDSYPGPPVTGSRLYVTRCRIRNTESRWLVRQGKTTWHPFIGKQSKCCDNRFFWQSKHSHQRACCSDLIEKWPCCHSNNLLLINRLKHTRCLLMKKNAASLNKSKFCVRRCWFHISGRSLQCRLRTQGSEVSPFTYRDVTMTTAV